MCTIISINNNKGGVGKTTTTEICAEILGFIGLKVLVVDLDPQGNASLRFKNYIEDTKNILIGAEIPPEKNIAELLKFRFSTKEEVQEVIKKTQIKNVDIIPSSKRHKNTVTEILKNNGNNNVLLKRALDTIKDDYDIILIDNAPASDVLTVNSLFASDYVLTPVRMEEYSYRGLKETLDTILYIKQEHAITNANFLGVFITQAEVNTVVYKEYQNSYIKELGDKFLRTCIRKDIKVSELNSIFEPLLEYAPDTNAVFDYAHLVLEWDILDEEHKQLLEKCIGE